MNIVTSVLSPTEAAYQFARRLDTLTTLTQSGVAELLQKLFIRTHGDKSLLDAIEEQRIQSDPYYQGENGCNNFYCGRLNWIATDLNNEIGNSMTVENALNILRAKGFLR